MHLSSACIFFSLLSLTLVRGLTLSFTRDAVDSTNNNNDDSLGTDGNSIQAIGCVSQGTFGGLVASAQEGGGKGSFRSASRVACAIKCRKGTSIYAYYTPATHACYCGDYSEYPAADALVIGADAFGSCKRKDASVDCLHSPFVFDGCYARINATDSLQPTFNTITDTTEDCTNYCEAYVYELGTVAITVSSESDDGHEFADFNCTCYTGLMPGIHPQKCGPNAVSRYYSIFDF